MLVLRRIHVVYHLIANEKDRPTVERVHRLHVANCPIYRSLHKAIAITTEFRLVRQFVMLGVVSMGVEIPILIGYGWLAERGGNLLPPRFSSLSDRIAGVCLVGAGAGLASMRKL